MCIWIHGTNIYTHTCVCARACVRVIQIHVKLYWNEQLMQTAAHHHHHHHPLANMEMGHLLTHSGVTRLEF